MIFIYDYPFYMYFQRMHKLILDPDWQTDPLHTLWSASILQWWCGEILPELRLLLHQPPTRLFLMLEKFISTIQPLRFIRRRSYISWSPSINVTHATRASLPSHLSSIKNFVNEIWKVSYVGSHRINTSNQTLGNFWENAILIFCNVKIGPFLQVLNLSFPLIIF